MANVFVYTMEANISQLQEEISSSDITIAIGGIISNNMEITLTFKTDISTSEEVLLGDIITNHTPEFIAPPDEVRVAAHHKDEDNTLVVYPTTIPDGWHVCFQGSGDSESEVGGGEKVIFHMTSRDDTMVKEAYFNTDVYVKDGYMISKDAPFGAAVDIEAVHPIYGPLTPFAKDVPIFGSGWFPMDTDGRAHIPKGIGLRITVKNSNGGTAMGQSPFEQPPADFWFAGRFEVYRKKLS